MPASASHDRLTPQEYLARERAAEFKSEYYDGRVYAMAGASREHNLIGGNIARALGNQLEDRSREAYSLDMRVRVSPAGLYTYPDLAVVCGTPRFEDDRRDTLLNPTVVVEILSPSTEAYDRGEKFANYRRLESLREYVLVSQNRICVERFTRRGDEWFFTEWNQPNETLMLDSVGCALSLSAVYARVEVPQGGLPRVV